MIDQFIKTIILDGYGNLKYRKREEVSSIRRAIDNFEKAKREQNKGTRPNIDEINDLTQKINFIVEQAKQMEAEFACLKNIQLGINPFLPILKDNIEQLLKMGGKIDKNTLVIKSPNITLRYKNDKVDLGIFEISIDKYGVESIIGENICNDCSHPHIYDCGEFCMGGYYDLVYKLLRTGQWVKAYYIIIEFLNSYNPRDCFCSLQYWTTPYCEECGYFEYECECEE